MFQVLQIILFLKFTVGSYTIYVYYFVILSFVIGFIRFLLRSDK